MSNPTPPPGISRRTVLRGLGAAVALPWLESLAPALPTPTPRLIVLFMPNGVLPEAWWPKGQGPELELSPSLSPLEPVRDDVIVLRGLFNRNSLEGEGHYVKTTALLSGAKVKRTGGRDLRCGTTVDQVVAQHVGAATRLPSLELGIEPIRPVVDMGYSTVYGGTISWSAPDRPTVKEIHPRLVYDRLFRSLAVGRRTEERAVIDLVRDEARALERRLSGADRARVGEYLEGLHELGRRIQRFEQREGAIAAEATAMARPRESLPEGHEDHVRLMMDLMVAALATDATRVITFMFGNAVSGRNFAWLDGVRGAHHPLSHHENEPDKKAQYALINRWHVARYAELLARLRATRVAERPLLDDSIVLLASGIADGNAHDPKDIPILWAGGAAGRVRTGRYLRSPRKTPLCRLHLSILQAFGLELQTFGDADRPLTGLLT